MLVLPVKITLINKPVKIMLILRIKRRNFDIMKLGVKQKILLQVRVKLVRVKLGTQLLKKNKC